MGIALTDNTATIGTTEYSLPANANYSAGSPQTTDCISQLFVDASAMLAGDTFRVRAYERVNGGTQAPVYEATLVGVQSGLFVLPCLVLGDGFDYTIKKIAGTDRSFKWSHRTVT